MEILGTTIKPGQSAQLKIELARLHTRTKIEVPIIIERSKKIGPVVLLSAGIHGNEVNGVEIVRQIIAKGYNKPTAGTIICMPVANIFGFLNQRREFPDGRDLNRMFPGNANGSLASKFAHSIMHDIIPHIDYCIDYHTGGAQRFNYSQVRIAGTDEETKKLAEIFGARFILKAAKREKSMREAIANSGKKVLLFEGGKSLNLDRIVTRIGIDGALRVLHHLNMRDFTTELEKREPEKTLIYITKSTWVRAKYSGMFRSSVPNGSYVLKGEKLGSISDPFGSFEKKVKAPNNGYIICANHAPIVTQGDAIFHLSEAFEKKEL